MDLSWAVDTPPIGIWATACGTFGVMMSDTLCFSADGTGYLLSRSVMRGEERLEFRWKHAGPGHLEIAVVHPEEELDWEPVHYCRAVVTNDTGSEEVLRNVSGEDFWYLLGPVTYVGPAV